MWRLGGGRRNLARAALVSTSLVMIHLRGSTCWVWRVTLLALWSVNDVSYVMRINHEIHFCVAGAVFAEGGVWLFVAGAAFRAFWEIAGVHVVFFHMECVAKMGRVRSAERRVRDDHFIFGLCSDHARISNRLYCGGSNLRSFRCNLELGRRSIWYIWWSYRVTFSSAHCKWVVQ